MRASKKQVNIGSKEIECITLENDNGMKVECLNLGGIITQIIVPDRMGKMENIVLGYKNLETYLENPAYFGAIIGRTSGRIHKGEVEVDGVKYTFSQNSNGNTLHGGIEGFSHKVWNVVLCEDEKSIGVVLSYRSVDGEEGYPGNLEVSVTYTLTSDNELILDYTAHSDKDTLVNLTNHSYFNLAGDIKEQILDHVMYIDSDKVCKLDSESIPIGKWINVKEDSAFDFNEPKVIGRDIDTLGPSLQSGYDHPWMLNKTARYDAYYYAPSSGRIMNIKTEQEAIVIYAMNFADPLILYNDKEAAPRYGICFETQSLPIGYNECYKEASLLKAGEKYNKKTIFKFGVKA